MTADWRARWNSPASGLSRRYRARARGRITQERLDELKTGIVVEGVHYGSIEATLDKAKEGPQGANLWITIALAEGKNREVRRVLEALGLKVNRLIRLAYGPLALGTLGVGEVEEVGPRVLREQFANYIAPANLPKGDRPQLVATLQSPGSTGRRARPAAASGPAGKSAEATAPAKPKAVYKAGWAKPKIAAKSPGHKRAKPKSLETKMIGPRPATDVARDATRRDTKPRGRR